MGRTGEIMSLTLAQATDADLIASISTERSQAAFAELWSRHQAACHGLALKITGSDDAALDALQEALLKLWTSAGTFRENVNPRGWIMKIVARECLKHLRGRRTSARLAMKSGIAAAAPPREDAAERAEVIEKLRALLGNIAPLDQQLVALYFGAEFTHAEIAKELDLPPSTISYKLGKVMDALRGGLEKAGFAALAVEVAPLLAREASEGMPLPQGAADRLLGHALRPGRASVRSVRRRPVRAASQAPIVAPIGVLVLALLGYLLLGRSNTVPARSNPSESSAGVPAVAEPAVHVALPAPAVPSAPNRLSWYWHFADGAPKDVTPNTGAWVLERGLSGATEAVLAPEKTIKMNLPDKGQGAVLVRVRLRSYQRGPAESFIGCFQSDAGGLIPARRYWGLEGTAVRSYFPYMAEFYFVDQWQYLTSSSGPFASLVEVSAPAVRAGLTLQGTNVALLDVEVHELSESETRDLRARIETFKRGRTPEDRIPAFLHEPSLRP